MNVFLEQITVLRCFMREWFILLAYQIGRSVYYIFSCKYCNRSGTHTFFNISSNYNCRRFRFISIHNNNITSNGLFLKHIIITEPKTLTSGFNPSRNRPSKSNHPEIVIKCKQAIVKTVIKCNGYSLHLCDHKKKTYVSIRKCHTIICRKNLSSHTVHSAVDLKAFKCCLKLL